MHVFSYPADWIQFAFEFSKIHTGNLCAVRQQLPGLSLYITLLSMLLQGSWQSTAKILGQSATKLQGIN